jgi:excisionase family DNA binding protein
VLTLTEAAERLGLAASTLRHQVQAGRLRARLIGKTYVVTAREVERYRATSLGRPGRPAHVGSTRTATSPLNRSQRRRATSTYNGSISIP